MLKSCSRCTPRIIVLILVGCVFPAGLAGAQLVPDAQPEDWKGPNGEISYPKLEGEDIPAAAPAEQMTSPITTSECDPSLGSGGLPNGFSGATTVAGLTATVVVPIGYDRTKPTYLALWIHGDGGNITSLAKANNPVNQFVTAQNWILLVPKSPGTSGRWWNRTQWSGDHRLQLAAAIQEMYLRYNVCRGVMFASSGSGGSQFYVADWLPSRGAQFPAHAVIACGGSPPWQPTESGGSSKTSVIYLAFNTSVMARTTMHFLYGTGDRLAPGIQRAIDFFRDPSPTLSETPGFKVQVTLQGIVAQPGGHCNVWQSEGLPTWATQTVNIWTSIAKAKGYIP